MFAIKFRDAKSQGQHSNCLLRSSLFEILILLFVWFLFLISYSLSRTFLAPRTMLINFCLEAHLAVWLNPQSGATESFSAGTYFKHFPILSTTSFSVSI
jgi:hypothetical protein